MNSKESVQIAEYLIRPLLQVKPPNEDPGQFLARCFDVKNYVITRYIHMGVRRYVALEENEDLTYTRKLVQINHYKEVFVRVNKHYPSWVDVEVLSTQGSVESRVFKMPINQYRRLKDKCVLVAPPSRS